MTDKQVVKVKTQELIVRAMEGARVADIIGDYPEVWHSLLDNTAGGTCQDNMERLTKSFQEYVNEMKEVSEKSLVRALFRNGLMIPGLEPEPENRLESRGLFNWIPKKKKK